MRLVEAGRREERDLWFGRPARRELARCELDDRIAVIVLRP